MAAYAIPPNGGKPTYLNGTFINPYILGVIVVPNGPETHRSWTHMCPWGHTTKALYSPTVYGL